MDHCADCGINSYNEELLMKREVRVGGNEGRDTKL